MNDQFGVHGYDIDYAPSMQPIFAGIGPSFKNGVEVNTSFSNADLIHLIGRILGLNRGKVDGKDRIDVWNQMLKTKQKVQNF